MKVYTKTGDKGTTSLVGGKRVAKTDLHLEVYGTLDELDSFMGLLKSELPAEHQAQIQEIQELFITINALFANEDAAWDAAHPLDEKYTLSLEKTIDQLSADLPPITSFLIPGSSKINALCNVCRSVCRRAERQAYHLDLLPNQSKSAVYLNRLSDFFFILGRIYS